MQDRYITGHRYEYRTEIGVDIFTNTKQRCEYRARIQGQDIDMIRGTGIF